MSEPPNFIEIYEYYENKLTNGDRATIKRVLNPYDLEMIPAFYKLLKNKANKQWARIIYFMPYVKHKKGAETIGKILAEKKVNERRIFQIIRSESPKDLIQLRRIVKQIKPMLDWQKFGKMLLSWEKTEKKQMIKEFFINQKD